MIWWSTSCAMIRSALSSCRVLLLIIIVSWNVRGMGNLSKRHRIKEVLLDVLPDFIAFQESKPEVVESSTIAQLAGWSDFSFAYSLSINRASGLICCWNGASFRKDSRMCSPQFTVIKGS